MIFTMTFFQTPRCLKVYDLLVLKVYDLQIIDMTSKSDRKRKMVGWGGNGLSPPDTLYIHIRQDLFRLWQFDHILREGYYVTIGDCNNKFSNTNTTWCTRNDKHSQPCNGKKTKYIQEAYIHTKQVGEYDILNKSHSKKESEQEPPRDAITTGTPPKNPINDRHKKNPSKNQRSTIGTQRIRSTIGTKRKEPPRDTITTGTPPTTIRYNY